ncbi:Non-specific lipid transfer protein GPI-anchored 21, partial [Linum grandiflorum]
QILHLYISHPITHFTTLHTLDTQKPFNSNSSNPSPKQTKMASLKSNSQTAILLSVASFLLLIIQFPQVLQAQITTPCTATGITGLTPCMNFLTNSSGNGAASPTEDCCNTLKNLTGASMDCICLVLAAGVPFQLPINRNLAISLPRACNMPGVPLQCKAAAGSPVPAPGPAALGPSLPPSDTPSGSVVPGTPSDGSTPGSGTTTPAMSPPPPTTGTTPTPTTINSSPPSSYSFSPLLAVLPFLLLIKFN